MREIEVEPIEHILKSYRGNCVCLNLFQNILCLEDMGVQIKQDWPWVNTVENGQWVPWVSLYYSIFICLKFFNTARFLKNEILHIKYPAQCLENGTHSIIHYHFHRLLCFLSVPLGNIFSIHLKFILWLHRNPQDSCNAKVN